MPLWLDGSGGEGKEKEAEGEAEVRHCRYGKRSSPGLWVVSGVCVEAAMFHSLPSTPRNDLRLGTVSLLPSSRGTLLFSNV